MMEVLLPRATQVNIVAVKQYQEHWKQVDLRMLSEKKLFPQELRFLSPWYKDSPRSKFYEPSGPKRAD